MTARAADLSFGRRSCTVMSGVIPIWEMRLRSCWLLLCVSVLLCESGDRREDRPFAVDLYLHKEEAFLVAERLAEAFCARASSSQILDLFCEAIDLLDVALRECLGLVVKIDGILVGLLLYCLG